jgi:hypothetical protein
MTTIAQTRPRPVAGPGQRTARTAGAGLLRALFTLIALGVTLVNLAGAPYYLAPLAVRVRHPLHAWLKPSGPIGQSIGLLAFALFLFLWLYPIRKAFSSRLRFTGSLAGWLEWHVAAGLLVPWLAATHAGWRFTGLIGMGYLAMFIVYLSGLIGRYLYARIPRHRDGVELTLDEAGAERERLLFELTASTGLPPDVMRTVLAPDTTAFEGLGLIGTVRRLIADDLSRRRAARSLARRVAAGGAAAARLRGDDLKKVLHLARREMALAQQVRMLEATQRAFRYWHVAHKPVAITALLAVTIHIAVAIVLGATWFR